MDQEATAPVMKGILTTMDSLPSVIASGRSELHVPRDEGTERPQHWKPEASASEASGPHWMQRGCGYSSHECKTATVRGTFAPVWERELLTPAREKAPRRGSGSAPIRCGEAPRHLCHSRWRESDRSPGGQPITAGNWARLTKLRKKAPPLARSPVTAVWASRRDGRVALPQGRGRTPRHASARRAHSLCGIGACPAHPPYVPFLLRSSRSLSETIPPRILSPGCSVPRFIWRFSSRNMAS